MGTMTKLLLTLLIMVVGANLIDPVNSAVSSIVTPTYSSSVSSLSALMPLFFVIVIYLYIFKDMGGV